MEMRFSLDEIRAAARAFWDLSGDHRIFLFYGPMGSGKTSFIHALCDVKGVVDAVASPTFSIINEYEFEDKNGPGYIFHIDLYRLKNEKEAIDAGVEDCIYSDHICLIEWPERIPGILPKDALQAHFRVIDDRTREISILSNVH